MTAREGVRCVCILGVGCKNGEDTGCFRLITRVNRQLAVEFGKRQCYPFFFFFFGESVLPYLFLIKGNGEYKVTS